MFQFRRYIALPLCALMLFSSTTALAAEGSAAETLLNAAEEEPILTEQQPTETEPAAKPEELPLPEEPAEPQLNLMLNGAPLMTDAQLLQKDNLTYVPLREFCQALGCNVYWDNATGIATVSRADDLYMQITVNSDLVNANGRWLRMPAVAANLNGKIMVPIRGLETVFTLTLTWDAATLTVAANGGTALEHADTFYNADDLYWLSHIINAESGNEPLDGKIAVGNVVINRTKHRSFPDTIYGVIFDRAHGVQFTPAKSGSIYRTPNTESIIAAKLALEGVNVAGECTYFVDPHTSPRCWVMRNCTRIMDIGTHAFFIY